MFSSPKDDREIDQVNKINNQFTTDQAIHEMNHPFTTQPNESINMRNAEGAPKHKHFSRSETLQHRVYTSIGIHNMGYANFYRAVGRLLSIECPFFLNWNEQRDVRKDNQKIYENTLEHKRKRAYKANAKRKEDIYLESIQTPKDGDYKPKQKNKKRESQRRGCQTRPPYLPTTSTRTTMQSSAPTRRITRKNLSGGGTGRHANEDKEWYI